MSSGLLRATAFRGDPDVDALHDFFRPENHYAGDTLWSFGTSLKGAYVDSFEFMNHAPVVQLWREPDDTIAAVSRISLGLGEWFHQATPDRRGAAEFEAIVAQADAAFELLSEHESWRTVCYRSKRAQIEQLESLGYVADGTVDVYMQRSLDRPVDEAPQPAGVEVGLLDRTDAPQVRERALAQVDAFTEEPPTPSEVAWIVRTFPNQLAYGRPGTQRTGIERSKTSAEFQEPSHRAQPHPRSSPAPQPEVTAVDADGSVLAFADVFFDQENKIAEFEPVGTRPAARGMGLAKAVTTHGLLLMREAGMRDAVVRTGADNTAAIATYESVGFEVTDELIDFRKHRA